MKKNNTIIIAEAGVNHNGKLAVAKKLVNAAKNVGADIVKFQTYRTENIVQTHQQTEAQQDLQPRDLSTLHQM